MNDKIVEFISDIDSDSFDDFKKDALIDSSIDLNRDIKEYDYSWLNQVEQYLPFVINITSMDFSKADISVFTSYENRFIRTLIIRLHDFILNEKKKYNKINEASKEKKFKAHLKTLLDNEMIEIDIKVKSTQAEEQKKKKTYGLSVEERIERVIKITNILLESSFMKSLKDTSLVHSPINKTEIFEEEANYRKALELFNFIDNYSEINDSFDINLAKSKLDEKFLITSFLEYQLLNDCFKENKNENVYRAFLERLIEKMVLDSSMDEKNFKKLLTKKFEDEYIKKKNREKNIQNIFFKSIDSYNKQVKDALRALKN